MFNAPLLQTDTLERSNALPSSTGSLSTTKPKDGDKNKYGRKVWFGWKPKESLPPDQADTSFMNARENFKDATRTHSKILVAIGIFLTGVGGVLVTPLAFSTLSDLCEPDAHNPRGCRNAKNAAAGAVLICTAGIITGLSLCLSDQRKQQRVKDYKRFQVGGKAV